eukprot:2886369-Pleurochrysis_carterae.AAC.2
MHLLRTLLEPSLVGPTKIQHGSHGAHADVSELWRLGNGTENALRVRCAAFVVVGHPSCR